MPIVFRVHRFTNQGSSLVCGNENDVVRIVKCFVCDFVIVFLATEVDAFLRERVNTVFYVSHCFSFLLSFQQVLLFDLQRKMFFEIVVDPCRQTNSQIEVLSLYIQNLRKHTCCKNCKPLVGSFTRRLKNLLESYFFVPRSIAPHAVYE